jgi:hypothetical protein
MHSYRRPQVHACSLYGGLLLQSEPLLSHSACDPSQGLSWATVGLAAGGTQMGHTSS